MFKFFPIGEDDPGKRFSVKGPVRSDDFISELGSEFIEQSGRRGNQIGVDLVAIDDPETVLTKDRANRRLAGTRITADPDYLHF